MFLDRIHAMIPGMHLEKPLDAHWDSMPYSGVDYPVPIEISSIIQERPSCQCGAKSTPNEDCRGRNREVHPDRLQPPSEERQAPVNIYRILPEQGASALAAGQRLAFGHLRAAFLHHFNSTGLVPVVRNVERPATHPSYPIPAIGFAPTESHLTAEFVCAANPWQEFVSVPDRGVDLPFHTMSNLGQLATSGASLTPLWKYDQRSYRFRQKTHLCCNKVKLSACKGSMIHANAP